MTRLALTAVLALQDPAAGQGPAAGSAAGGPSGRYLASGGVVYEWDGASARIAPAEERGDLPAEPEETLALETFAGGERLLLLQAPRTEAGKTRGRKEGLALILDTTGAAPKRLHQVPFEGRPYRSAITPEGGRAYVLAHRPSPGGDRGAGRSWIHQIDLARGRLLGSAHLSASPVDIAVQPDGRRVFVTLAGRIRSFSTDPLVGSWHYRSPGANGYLVIRSGDGTLCVTRGEEVALFDPAAIAARGTAGSRGRIDDASGIIPLPFQALGLGLSDDGRLAVVRGADRLAFLDCATQSLVWPADPPAGIAGAADVKTLAFPAAGSDLIVALLPAGDVVGIRTPEPPPTAAGSPSAGRGMTPAAAPPAEAETPPAAPPDAAPEAAPPSNPAAGTSPDLAAGPTGQAAGLSGRVTGDRSRVGAIVLYGPNSIVKEFGRVRPDPDGSWRAPLPPDGTYRLVAIADGSTPLAASPTFLTVQVTAGKPQSGLDFDIRGGPPETPGG